MDDGEGVRSAGKGSIKCDKNPVVQDKPGNRGLIGPINKTLMRVIERPTPSGSVLSTIRLTLLFSFNLVVGSVKVN